MRYTRRLDGRHPGSRWKQREVWRKRLSANDLGDKSARQLETARVGGEGKFAEGFKLCEVESQAVGTAETAQNSPLQGERLGLEES
jgi:hypothetical protein